MSFRQECIARKPRPFYQLESQPELGHNRNLIPVVIINVHRHNPVKPNSSNQWCGADQSGSPTHLWKWVGIETPTHFQQQVGRWTWPGADLRLLYSYWWSLLIELCICQFLDFDLYQWVSQACNRFVWPSVNSSNWWTWWAADLRLLWLNWWSPLIELCICQFHNFVFVFISECLKLAIDLFDHLWILPTGGRGGLLIYDCCDWIDDHPWLSFVFVSFIILYLFLSVIVSSLE